MRKLISLFLSVCLLFTFGFSAYAADSEADLDIKSTNSTSTTSVAQPLTTGLITLFSLSFVRGDGNYNTITGTTSCLPSVVKCGMKDIMIQWRLNSNYSWADYLELDEYLVDRSTCSYYRSIALPVGHQYRVTWKHYAKKSLLSTEKISKTSSAITIPKS